MSHTKPSPERVMFDVDKALYFWAERYPDREERIEVLRGQLADCEQKPGTSRHTIIHIKEMLERLGVKT